MQRQAQGQKRKGKEGKIQEQKEEKKKRKKDLKNPNYKLRRRQVYPTRGGCGEGRMKGRRG
jgi:hypothetical protein